MKTVTCSKCGEGLLNADHSYKEEIVQFTIKCVCGKDNVELFEGYPRLMGIDKYYFEFIDEFKVKCEFRHRNKK